MFTFLHFSNITEYIKNTSLGKKMTTQSLSLQMSLDIFHFNVIKVNTTLQAFINSFYFTSL